MNVPQFPLVLDDKVGAISKTKEAVALLKKFGAYEDVLRCINAKKTRPGIGQNRNKKYKLRRGPLFVVNDESMSLVRALKNIPGVSTINVKRLNIRHLAPGSQVGRFAIFTESAFKELENQFGSFTASGNARKHFILKKEVVANSDIAGIINSDEIQRVLNTKKTVKTLHYKQKKNPLRNKGEMAKKMASKVKKIRKTRKAFTKKSGDVMREVEAKISNVQKDQNAEYKRLMIETR